MPDLHINAATREAITRSVRMLTMASTCLRAAYQDAVSTLDQYTLLYLASKTQACAYMASGLLIEAGYISEEPDCGVTENHNALSLTAAAHDLLLRQLGDIEDALVLEFVAEVADIRRELSGCVRSA